MLALARATPLKKLCDVVPCREHNAGCDGGARGGWHVDGVRGI